MKRKLPFLALAAVLITLFLTLLCPIGPMRPIGPTPSGSSVHSLSRESGYFTLTARDSSGRVLWTEHVPNGLADEGESAFLDCTFRATNCPSTFYLRLFNDTPVETDTLAALTGEPTTNGYAAQQLTRDSTGWPTLALDSGDFMATSKTVTFQATGGAWGPVTYVVLATSSDNTGKLISYAALSTSRTLASGESLQVTYKLKLQ